MARNFKIIYQYFLILLGGSLVGLAVGWILLPLKLSTGGFSGIATVLFYVYKIPAEFGIVILNIPLVLISIKVLGIGFTFRSLIGTIAISISISIAEKLEPLTEDILLASIFGGFIVGIGLALAIRGEGTTGGTDLVAKIVHKKRPLFNLGQIILMIDFLIITSSAFIFKNVDVALYSLVAVFIMTNVLDFITQGVNDFKAMFIISTKPNEVSDYIIKEIGRGATGLYGKGMYTGEDKQVLFCIVNKIEILKLKRKIKEIDNKAFIIVTPVTETVGEGFKINE
jgi:uncharacterized membrane-anchored protein YitT (DUF2179 family)